jgi:SagB-type dehydrogenase family enzyme
MHEDWERETIQLPHARRDGPMSLEATMVLRRSEREFGGEPLSLADAGQLLWAAQGITRDDGLRTAPSAGARFPVEVYAVVRQGVFHYRPTSHSLQRMSAEDRREALAAATRGQAFVATAPLTIVLACVLARTLQRYGEGRGMRYVAMDVGHAAQNVLLQAVALGLVSVPVGAFEDQAVHDALSLPGDHAPMYLLPVGKPARA